MATKFGGYMGRVVLVDLSTQTTEDYPWTDADREKYIGGKIMAAKVLNDHLTGTEKPFSEENWIVVSTGPLTGTGAPSSSRFDLSCLSPQTGILTSSNCGGSFGYHLKKAGIDALILKGRCEKHTWIEIDNGTFTFHDADEDGLWGLKTTEGQEKVAVSHRPLSLEHEYGLEDPSAAGILWGRDQLQDLLQVLQEQEAAGERPGELEGVP